MNSDFRLEISDFRFQILDFRFQIGEFRLELLIRNSEPNRISKTSQYYHVITFSSFLRTPGKGFLFFGVVVVDVGGLSVNVGFTVGKRLVGRLFSGFTLLSQGSNDLISINERNELEL